MITAIYARVSSEEQVEGYSIDAQIRAFHNLVEAKSWGVYKEYIEEGKSARTEDINKRPVFKEAMADGLANKYDILVVHKVDRFSRRLRVTLEYFDKLGRAGVGFFSIVEQMDFSTPWGKFTLTMLGGLAELYSDNLSQETKKGLHERRKQGLYCGTLPFGAIKGKDGIPEPDIEERVVMREGNSFIVKNYEGLKVAFDLAVQNKSDRDIAMALSASGYRTTGTHGARPFSKDTVKDMLKNRFYIGKIPDGNGGWLKANHQAFIDDDLFEMVQNNRISMHAKRSTVNINSRIYSLGGIAKCARCNGNIRMQTNPHGKGRVYCANRASGLGCDFQGTFLAIYEEQIEWYLSSFFIPENYQEQILESHRKLVSNYDEYVIKRNGLEAVLIRLEEQYRWGHIQQKEYLREHKNIESQLRQIPCAKLVDDKIKQLAGFLSNIGQAWKAANQEQRNKLSKVLFQEIILDSGGRVIAVKPNAELAPFFKLSYEYHKPDIAGDPEGI